MFACLGLLVLRRSDVKETKTLWSCDAALGSQPKPKPVAEERDHALLLPWGWCHPLPCLCVSVWWNRAGLQAEAGRSWSQLLPVDQPSLDLLCHWFQMTVACVLLRPPLSLFHL